MSDDLTRERLHDIRGELNRHEEQLGGVNVDGIGFHDYSDLLALATELARELERQAKLHRGLRTGEQIDAIARTCEDSRAMLERNLDDAAWQHTIGRLIGDRTERLLDEVRLLRALLLAGER